jgi:hypothetical protein
MQIALTRAATSWLFFANRAASGSWLPHIPDAKHALDLVTGKPTPAPFRYPYYRNLAIIGRREAVADFRLAPPHLPDGPGAQRKSTA